MTVNKWHEIKLKKQQRARWSFVCFNALETLLKRLDLIYSDCVTSFPLCSSWVLGHLRNLNLINPKVLHFQSVIYQLLFISVGSCDLQFMRENVSPSVQNQPRLA